MDDVPGAWSMLDGAPVKLFRPTVVEDVRPAAPPDPTGNGGPPPSATPPVPGTVVRTEPDGIVVATGEGGVLLAEVQPPGRRRMGAADWVHGRGVVPGLRFE
jgi:methionyl-tRNA formyltransferase